MIETSVIFSAPMIQAIRQGRKTMTRRLKSRAWQHVAKHHAAGEECWLWVRERCWIPDPDARDVTYHADHGDDPALIWRSARYMPRWAARIFLRVETVRLEPLHEITRNEAEAEGVVWESADPPFWYVPGVHPHSVTASETYEGPIACFAKLWDHLHDKPRTRWADNPEVYAISFINRKRPK
jgi:hypothetical protein